MDSRQDREAQKRCGGGELHRCAAWSRYRLHILLWHSGSSADPTVCWDTLQEAHPLLARLRQAAEEAVPIGTSLFYREHHQPRPNIWKLSPPIISSGAPSLNFEVPHQVLEFHYNTSPGSQSQIGEQKDKLWHTTSVYKNKGRITKNSCWLQSHTDGRGTVRAALLSNFASLAYHQACQTLVFQYTCSLTLHYPVREFGDKCWALK